MVTDVNEWEISGDGYLVKIQLCGLFPKFN